MATYSELFDLRNDSSLRNRITTAIAVQSDAIRVESGATPNHANRLLWAKRGFTNPEDVANEMLWGILAANKSFTVAQIQGATDAAILTAVANLVDTFATGA